MRVHPLVATGWVWVLLAQPGHAELPAADLNRIPPGLELSVNDIPESMNEHLLLPPGGFHVTLRFAAGVGSAIDPRSLRITSSRAVLGVPAGHDLAPLFDVSSSGARLALPLDAELERGSYTLTASILNAAGNASTRRHRFHVTDFGPRGAPFATRQTVFLDFDQNRSLGPDVDFLEDLREFGLSSAAHPKLEAWMRDWIVRSIVARAHPFYGRHADGSPTNDAVNLRFVAERPNRPASRLCVGGESAYGPSYLGTTVFDPSNASRSSDECIFGAFFGVFPAAMDDLWADDVLFRQVFAPLDPELGGKPVGEHPSDARLLDPALGLARASVEELLRVASIHRAVNAFAAAVATIVAHETAHLLGLVPHGPPPVGLFGGTSGGRADHNETPSGDPPRKNFLMNPGSRFDFADVAGIAGRAAPRFRALNWAYLRDRVVLQAAGTATPP